MITKIRVLALLITSLALSLTGAVLATSTGSTGASSSAPVLIEYHGTEGKAVLPLAPDRLPGAPAEFRKFVKRQLHALWDDLGHTAGCKTSPLITVDAIRTDGFGLGTVNTRPRKHCETGGGYVAFWAIRNGTWKEVIGTQEVVQCWRLEKFGIPSEIGVHECYQGGEVVPYDHA